MRVIHIIPSAFEYFDDIRSEVFKLIEGLYKMGIETEAFTLQYGGPTKTIKDQIKEDSPSVHNYISSTGAAGLVDGLAGFDIVHLHCPLLGAARQVLNWKKTHPRTPLVITYHRDVVWTDLFSLFIKLYNYYYLPKLFKVANIVVCQNLEELGSFRGSRHIDKNKDLAVLDEIKLEGDWVDPKWSPLEVVAAKTALIYNTFVS
jgi:hypothetical protein